MMKNGLVLILVLSLVIFLLCGCIQQGGPEEKTPSPATQPPPPITVAPTTSPPTQTPVTTQSPPTQPPTTPPTVRTFTMEEVSKHNTRNDCWLVIHGNVYDVTPFIAFHPGGAAILQGCGKDATELFEKRPMGSGTAHSSRARDLLAKYFIGILVNIYLSLSSFFPSFLVSP